MVGLLGALVDLVHEGGEHRLGDGVVVNLADQGADPLVALLLVGLEDIFQFQFPVKGFTKKKGQKTLILEEERNEMKRRKKRKKGLPLTSAMALLSLIP